MLSASCAKFAFSHPPTQPPGPEQSREPHSALPGWPARRGMGGTEKNLLASHLRAIQLSSTPFIASAPESQICKPAPLHPGGVESLSKSLARNRSYQAQGCTRSPVQGWGPMDGRLGPCPQGSHREIRILHQSLKNTEETLMKQSRPGPDD